MKCFFLAITLATMATPAIGQIPSDSGRCPWKLPFSVILDASFEMHEVEGIYDLNFNGLDTTIADFDAPDNSGIQFVVDSNFAQSSVGNTLTFSKDTALNQENSLSEILIIKFDSGYDSILSLSCSTDWVFNCGHCGSETINTFSFSGLRFDSTSIIYPDSSLSHTEFSYTSAGWNDVEYQNQEARERDKTNSIDVSQITLGGIFRPMILAAPSIVSSSNRFPAFLFQSFPNPFSRSTTISFTPDATGYANVSVMNQLGVEVTQLFSGELAAGEYSFTWSNPTGLPDGTYECLIRMNGRVETLPIMLLH